jgi:hypothetical protein
MKLRLNNKLRYLFYVALACVSTACSFQEVNRDRLGHEPHLMIDKDGSVWIVEHHTGDLYTVKFLSDSVEIGKPCGL